jgi:hypothetical protein
VGAFWRREAHASRLPHLNRDEDDGVSEVPAAVTTTSHVEALMVSAELATSHWIKSTSFCTAFSFVYVEFISSAVEIEHGCRIGITSASTWVQKGREA